MPVQIGRYPRGFLELLGSKTNGTTPSVLLDGVMPTVDMTEFWAQGASVIGVGATSTIGGTGPIASAVPLVVPIGEFWRVHSVSVLRSAVLAAATTYRISPLIYDPSVASSYITCDPLTWTAGEQPLITLNFDLPRIIPAGWAFGVWCHSVTLGTASGFNICVDYDRLT